jgi:hypothetical protein
LDDLVVHFELHPQQPPMVNRNCDSRPIDLLCRRDLVRYRDHAGSTWARDNLPNHLRDN